MLTECERIIQNGTLPQSFFEPEIRCDFLVDENRKKIWAIEMDLFLEFERVCKKHGLRYFVIAGTLLGAIRHYGFIPWDDDMDVAMPREDYEKLCTLYAGEFTSPYFFQTPLTDSNYFFSFAKLRNTNTTAVSMPYGNSMFNQGVFFDIFPLDFIELDKADAVNKEIFESIMKCSSFMKKGSEDILSSCQKENMKRYHTDNPMEEYDKIQSLAQSFQKSDFIGLNVCTIYDFKKLAWPTKCFEEAEVCSFEGLEITIPKGWDGILYRTYGDYMQYPPVESRGAWHSGTFFNPDMGYEYYQLPNKKGWKLQELEKLNKKK